MSFFTNQVDVGELEAGDHIYTYRTAYIYAHHGIYIGDHKVIGFTSGGSSSGFSSFSSISSHTRCNTFSECGLKRPNNNHVVITCLDCFLQGRSVYRFNYGVSNFVRLTRIISGTCTTRDSDPSETVIHRAKLLLENGFLDYNLVSNNCEGFAYYCKTEFLIVPRFTTNPKRHQIKTISGQTTTASGQASAMGAILFKIIRISVEDLLLILQS